MTRKLRSSCPIAVVGLACWYPGASSPAKFWENILSRRRQFRRIPATRLSMEDYYSSDPDAPDKTYVFQASMIDGFQFDWKARRTPYRTYLATDISHWLALETALCALSDAGYSPENVPGENAGVIVGNSLTGDQSRANAMRLRWPFFRRVVETTSRKLDIPKKRIDELTAAMEWEFKSVFPPASEDSLSGGLSNTIAGRICNFLNLRGGGYTIDGACSSSLLAVAAAATGLACGDLDLALAGGIDISIDPFELVGFAKTRALAKGNMKVYDRNASGFLPGEGCGFAVLKRLEDAIGDGDYTYAVLHGWGVSSDGSGAALTATSAKGQFKALERAYATVPFSPGRLDFIEGHGTGTAVGDAAELESISMAMEKCPEANPSKFGPDEDRPDEDRPDEDRSSELRPCGLTSVKSIIGHTKAAAGIAGFIKAVMAVNQRVVPPTAACRDFHPAFEKKARMIYPVVRGEVASSEQVLRAGVSSMGFGGINCHVALSSGDAPSPKLSTSMDPRVLLVSESRSELFAFSAPTPDAMTTKLRTTALDGFGISMAEMTDLAAQMAGAIDHGDEFRCCIVARDPEDLSDKLRRAIAVSGERLSEREFSPTEAFRGIWFGRPTDVPQVGMLFPGQGSQQINMARKIAERFEWAGRLVKDACRWMADIGAKPVDAIMFRPDDRSRDRGQSEKWSNALAMTEHAQPAICLASAIWKKHLDRLGVAPYAVGGHSLGELTAFYAAGAFDEKALVQFSALRGRALSADCDRSGKMASLRCPAREVETILGQIDGYAVLANVNSPTQTVISGECEAVEQAVAKAKGRGIAAFILPVSNGFHSELLPDWRQWMGKASIPRTLPDRLSVRLFSGKGGREVFPGIDLKRHFGEQTLSPVEFTSLVEAMARVCDIFIEVGPGNVLSRLVGEIQPGARIACFPTESSPGADEDLNRAVAELYVRGAPVDIAKLFENRLTMPFVPARKKVFIENPCEKLPASPDSRDVFPSPRSRGTSRVRGPQAKNDRKMVVSDAQKPLAKPLGRKEMENALYSIVEELTGFSKESLSPELRLLEDLNLDSIKAGDLLVKAANAAGLGTELVPLDFANASLAEILDRLENSEKANDSADGETTSTQTHFEAIPKAFMEPAWVRDYRLKMEIEPLVIQDADLKAGIDDHTKNAPAAVVYPDGLPEGREMADALIAEFKRLQFPAEISPVGKASEHLSEKLAGCSLLFFVFPAEWSGQNLRDNLRHMVCCLSNLARLATSLATSLRMLVAAGFGGGYFGVENRLGDMESSCVSSFVKSLYLERPNVNVRILDFVPSADKNWVARKVLMEACSPGICVSAGYDRKGVRRILFAEAMDPGRYDPMDTQWSDRDVVLATGGAKGITAAIALELAKRTKARIALVGSTPYDEATGGGNDEISRTLEKYEAMGLTAKYYCCDVVDSQAVKRMADAVARELGPVSAVVHGAALNIPRTASRVSAEEALEEIAPKVVGAINLIEATGGRPLKVFAGLSSVIASTGMPGNAWYAFSNEALEIIVANYGRTMPETHAFCAAYSIWSDEGMGVRMGSAERLKRLGIGTISTSDGVEHFLRLFFHNSGTGRAIVSSRIDGIHTWRQKTPPKPVGARFLETPVFVAPKVESIYKAKLTLARDLYLKDHFFDGSYLMPAVFGLEAMAQVAASTLGLASFERVRVEDIYLRHPITVDSDFGAEIFVRALVEERGRGDRRTVVRTAIVKPGAIFDDDFFSARFVFEPDALLPRADIELPETDLGIRPETDLYRDGLLFQGPRFQRIRRVFRLGNDGEDRSDEVSEALFETVMETRQVNEASSFPSSGKAALLLGDPYFRDALLQSAGLLSPKKTQLPFHIECWDMVACPAESRTGFFCKAELARSDDKDIVCNTLCATDEGRILERLENCHLKVLKRRDENPSPAELANPGDRDEALLKKQVERFCRLFSLHAPVVKLEYLPGEKGSQDAESREMEVRLVRRAAAEVFGKDAAEVEQLDVRWTNDEKTAVSLPHGDEAYFSTALDDRLAICSFAPFVQGCATASIGGGQGNTEQEQAGKEGQALPELLMRQGELPETAEAMLRASLHAAKKAVGVSSLRLFLEKREEKGALFRVENDREDLYVLAMSIFPTWGRERILAVLVRPAREKLRGKQRDEEKTNGYEDLFSLQSFSNIVEESKGRTVFVYRVPVTFKPTAHLSRKVYFSQYFKWLGEARETAIWPILKRVGEQISSGQWGLVTNHSRLKILGEATTSDKIEIRLWAPENETPRSPAMDLTFEFRKALADGGYERLAMCEQQVTWVRVLTHGVVQPEPYPDYYWNLMKDMLHPRNATGLLEPLPEPLALLCDSDRDELVYRAPLKPVIEPVLCEKIMETSLENSNLVGNIYFTNYYSWQGKVRDHYLFGLIPEYFRGTGKNGELICLECSVKHLREAMPFDRISVTMALKSLRTRSVVFHFEYYRIGPDGRRIKLAYGQQRAMWVRRDENSAPVPGPFPERFHKALLKAIGSQLN